MTEQLQKREADSSADSSADTSADSSADTSADTSSKGPDSEDAETTSAPDKHEQRTSAEEFAREHDPADHDIAAGEESRQRGDWTADEADDEGDGTPTANHDTSSLEEVRDGGYGVGSAALVDGGAMPLGHPVKAWEDTRTFAETDHPSYGDADPHLWFTDAGAAEQAGFRSAPS